MWSNKEIKACTRKNMKLNYWGCIAVCFLMLIFSIEYTTSGTFLGEKSDVGMEDNATSSSQEYKANIKGSDAVDQTMGDKLDSIEDENVQQATKGVLASLANGITAASNTLAFIADAVQKVIGKSPVASFLVSLLGVMLSLAFFMFFKAQLMVGERRFFLENRLYHDTRITRIFHMYSTKHVWNISVIMLLRQLFFYLWCLTIVGGFIKNYEYRAIPYILAENPGISRKECFALSKEMTYGHKMEMFKFDLTFLLWMILSFCSLGLLGVFYANPYYRGSQAEVHVKLREYAKAANTEHISLLTDDDLYAHSAEVLPADVYPTVKIREKHELSVPWDRKYSIVHIGLIFFAFAMIGWCWEVFYHFLLDGIIVNRGSMWGPWLPIYGIGGAAVVVLLKPLGKKPVVLSICTFFACGIIEFFTGWYFETIKGIKYWDYSNYLFNINGWVCLEGLIMFTVLASLGLYIIAPRFDNLFRKWPNGVKIPLLCILSLGFIGDMIYTHFHPHTGEGITSSGLTPEDNRIEL